MKNWSSKILIIMDMVFFLAFVYFLLPILALVAPALVHFFLHPIHNSVQYINNFGYLHFKNVTLPEFIIPIIFSFITGFILLKLHKIVFNKEEQIKIAFVFSLPLLTLFVMTELFYFLDFYEDEEPPQGISKEMVIQITVTYVTVFLFSVFGLFQIIKKYKSLSGK